MKQLLCLLLTGILAASLGFYLFNRSRLARAEGQATPSTEFIAEAQGGADHKEALTTCEPPSVEVLRLRSKVAQLREEAAKFQALWQAERNRNTDMRRKFIQLEQAAVASQPQNDGLSQQRVRRTGAWIGLAVTDATDYEEGVTREGVRVMEVVPQGPSIGLLERDDVIIAVDGRPIPDRVSFMKFLVGYPAETTFRFDILRKDVGSSVMVTSKQWPE